MRVITAHQPQFLPWVPFVDKADQAGTLIYLDTVQFDRRGVQHRNAIKTAHGPLTLTVPVSARRATPIKDVRIADPDWSLRHVATISRNYARAPFVDWFRDGLRPILERPWTFLVDLNRAATAWLFERFAVDCACLLASEMSAAGRKDELIINLCRAVHADVYLSGQGAEVYQDVAKFRECGLTLRYQDYVLQPYPQCHGELGFMPDLSSLDLLLNLGPKARDHLLTGRRTVL